jgi:hypothetical protein
MRRAMEAAGVAYLSKSEPDIGKIYGKGDESKLWKRIKRHKIFPEENPLTSELNEMMKRASSRFHSNLQSVVGSIEEDFEYRGSGVWIAFHFSINDGGRSLESSWEACHYILRAMYNVSQIFAKSFDLPEGPWYEQLQLFKNDLDSLNNKIGETIKTLPPPS